MSMRRAYIDACVVIYYLEKHPVMLPRVEAALFPASGGPPQLAFSDLTRLECRVLPLRRRDTSLLARYDAFFGLPDCERVSLDSAAFDLATELRAEYGLKTPDALHLAAAIRAGCDEFWTNDDRLARAAARRLAIVMFDMTS